MKITLLPLSLALLPAVVPVGAQSEGETTQPAQTAPESVDAPKAPGAAKPAAPSDNTQAGFLGVQLIEEGGRARIGALVPGGPAEAAGLLPGDVLVAIDSTAVRGGIHATALLQAKAPGTVVRVEFERRGRWGALDVELAPRPREGDPVPAPRLEPGPGGLRPVMPEGEAREGAPPPGPGSKGPDGNGAPGQPPQGGGWGWFRMAPGEGPMGGLPGWPGPGSWFGSAPDLGGFWREQEQRAEELRRDMERRLSDLRQNLERDLRRQWERDLGREMEDWGRGLDSLRRDLERRLEGGRGERVEERRSLRTRALGADIPAEAWADLEARLAPLAEQRARIAKEWAEAHGKPEWADAVPPLGVEVRIERREERGPR